MISLTDIIAGNVNGKDDVVQHSTEGHNFLPKEVSKKAPLDISPLFYNNNYRY